MYKSHNLSMTRRKYNKKERKTERKQNRKPCFSVPGAETVKWLAQEFNSYSLAVLWLESRTF